MKYCFQWCNSRPANIFISDDNLIIGDFGLSTRTSFYTGQSESASDLSLNKSMTFNLGTPLYSAPEQMTQNNYDSKVDVYSLGLILFEMNYTFKTMHEKHSSFNKLRNDLTLPV